MKELIYGAGGAVVIVGAIMGFIKKLWKPKVKQLYMIPAVILGFGASAIVSYLTSFAVGAFLIGGVLITGGQLFAENEVFAGAKELWESLQDFLITKL